MQLNNGNFTSLPSLPWCGDWEKNECCYLFGAILLYLLQFSLPFTLYIVFWDYESYLFGLLFCLFSFFYNTFPLFGILCQYFYVTVFSVSCMLPNYLVKLELETISEAAFKWVKNEVSSIFTSSHPLINFTD